MKVIIVIGLLTYSAIVWGIELDYWTPLVDSSPALGDYQHPQAIADVYRLDNVPDGHTAILCNNTNPTPFWTYFGCYDDGPISEPVGSFSEIRDERRIEFLKLLDSIFHVQHSLNGNESNFSYRAEFSETVTTQSLNDKPASVNRLAGKLREQMKNMTAELIGTGLVQFSVFPGRPSASLAREQSFKSVYSVISQRWSQNISTLDHLYRDAHIWRLHVKSRQQIDHSEDEELDLLEGEENVPPPVAAR